MQAAVHGSTSAKTNSTQFPAKRLEGIAELSACGIDVTRSSIAGAGRDVRNFMRRSLASARRREDEGSRSRPTRGRPWSDLRARLLYLNPANAVASQPSEPVQQEMHRAGGAFVRLSD
jgi:hypothetical protein